MQLDEKWAFVYKKQAHCSEEELAQERMGDCWDHVAFDPEYRLVLSVVFGKRIGPHVHEVIQQVKKQLGGRVPRLITSDEYASYALALQRAFSVVIKPTHKRGEPNPGGPRRQLLPGLTYATVCKRRENGRVVEVSSNVVFGTEQEVAAALEQSKVSSAVNTSFLERHNGTDRHRNSRKVRKTYRFSKDWDVHAAVGYFTLYSYNFCWCVRTLAQKDAAGRWHPRTPALAAGLATHIWKLSEWLRFPARSGAS